MNAEIPKEVGTFLKNVVRGCAHSIEARESLSETLDETTAALRQFFGTAMPLFVSDLQLLNQSLEADPRGVSALAASALDAAPPQYRNIISALLASNFGIKDISEAPAKETLHDERLPD